MPDALIIDAARTPWGKFGGALKDYSGAELAALCIRAILDRQRLDPAAVESLIVGQVLQGGAGQASGRQAAIAAGLPETTPATVVNKVCGSGMRAVTLAGQLIRAGEHDLLFAGGMESMTNAPYYDFATRWGARSGDVTLVDGLIYDGLWCSFHGCHMTRHGDTLAAHREVSREDMDEWAATSQRRWAEAQARGYFDREIVPAPNKRNPRHFILEHDENPRPTTAENLSRLPTVHETRAITAGNAPAVNDGAAILLVASETAAARHGLRPMARIVAQAEIATPPDEFPVASAHATRALLVKAGLTVDDIAVFEINEAFASIPLLCGQELGYDPARVNPNGGAVAMGHPIGASGARLALTAAYQLQESGGRYAIASICSGGGQGDAVLIENLSR